MHVASKEGHKFIVHLRTIFKILRQSEQELILTSGFIN